MKKLFILLAVCGLLFTACESGDDDVTGGGNTEQPGGGNTGGDDDGGDTPENISFALDKEEVSISPDGGSAEVVVYSNYKWEIFGTSDWCTPSINKGDANEDGQKVTFSAEVAYDNREAVFEFRCADKTIELVVKQNLKEVIIAGEDKTLNVPAEGGAVELAYQTSIECEVIIPEQAQSWISVAEDTKALVSQSVTLNIAKNNTGVENSAVVKVAKKSDGSIYVEYTITQERNMDYVILYTTSDDQIVNPQGFSCLSNTYEDGQGMLAFDASTTKIEANAFKNCTSLTSIAIPDSVTEIGQAAFRGCSSLTSATIGNGVTEIGDEAFYVCSSLTSVTIPDNVTKIGGWAFCGCSSLPSVTIPDSVTRIEQYVFSDCTLLTNITIPDSVTEIGNRVFWRCTSLTSITIPDSVTVIGSGVFEGCNSLESFYGKLASSDNRCLIVDGVLKEFAPANLTTYTIPDNVTKIGDRAFSNCTSLTNITIPDSVTEIKWAAFMNCTSLTNITIPNSVTEIGEGAFYDCTSLTSVTIPDSVTTIGSSAFYGCSSLTSIAIPNSVTEIGYSAFYGCTSLKEVYCKPTTPPTAQLDDFGDWDAFYFNASGRKIYVPAASVEAYKAADYWKTYADDIVSVSVDVNDSASLEAPLPGTDVEW